MYVRHSWLQTHGHEFSKPIPEEVDPAEVIRKLNNELGLNCPEELGYFIWDYMMLTYPTTKKYEFDPESGFETVRYLSESDADVWLEQLKNERQWADDGDGAGDSWAGVKLDPKFEPYKDGFEYYS